MRQLPAGMQFVISTRSQLPFPTQRLRARGEVLELSAADLAFDDEELTQVVANALGQESVDLAPSVMRLTDGWPAAARLVIEALRPLPSSARASAIGAARPVGQALFDYLAEEVLARESRVVVDLIRTLAPFDEVDLALCNALGFTDAAKTIDGLERRGMFVARLGSADAFAVHGLVRAFALGRLPLEPERLRATQEVAARWHEGRVK